KYISQCIDEIKQELKQDNIAVKANAVCKLTYLQMLGYDISWAAFNIIEVMSASKFTFKRIGYLAASQSFHEGTDVIMLTTNQIRKDLSSPSQYDTGVALTGLSCFVTPDLARDLANDIMTLMSHTKPYIRKKAVLIMYKVFLKYPESLRPAFPRLKEKLEDPDPGVQSAAVNVICELARRNPKNYLSLAPLFFKLMTSSTNNWVLIKIIKLAMLISLSSGMPNHSASIQLCVQKLRILIEDSDQNLKYLGLLAMSKILKTHPKSVQSHKDLILQCLDDKDESIRLRALDLLYGMVSKKNLMEIVKKLMTHVDKAEGTTYRDELLTKIIDICSQSNYQYITNFEWYISILVELTRLEGTRHGHLIAAQMLDVAIRVKAIRKFAVSQMSALLDSAHLLASSTQRNGICEVLYAAAWICGEFSEGESVPPCLLSALGHLWSSQEIVDPVGTRTGRHLQEPHHTLEAMLRPKVTTLPGHIQAVYVQNVVKLYANILQQKEQAGEAEGAQAVTQLMVDRLPQFVQSADLEVQERASCILQLVKHIQKLQAKDVPVAEEVSTLFAGELNPVAPKAQKKVPVPEGLDLDAWINEPLSDSESEDERPRAVFHEEEQRRPKHRPSEADEEELARRREARKQEQANNPFYIKSSPSPQKRREARKQEQANNPFYIKSSPSPQKCASNTWMLLSQRYQDAPGVEHIPVVQIDLSVPLKVPGKWLPMSDQYVKLEEERRHRQKLEKDKRRKKRKEKEKKGKRRHSSLPTESDEDIAPAQQVDIVTEEMPENALPSDEDDKDPNDPYRALDIDLDKPLADSEKLPIQKHRNAETSKSPEKDIPVVEKKSKKPKKKEKKHKEKERDKEKKKQKEKKEELSVNAVTTPKDECEDAKTEAQDEEDNAEGQDQDKKSPKHKKKKHKKEKEERTKGKKKSKKQPLGSEEAEAAGEPVQNGAAEEEPLPTCDIRGSLQEDSQVTVAIVLENRSSSILKGMELSVLDSLNARMARPQGSSVHDGVPVPFQLPPGVSNEAQYVFTIQSIVMAQKLKGTLSFIAKNDEGATHEKLDFRLHFSCSSYLTTTPCYSDAFAKLLESGDLSMSSVKVDGIRMSFQNLLAKICFHHHFSDLKLWPRAAQEGGPCSGGGAATMRCAGA
ncbi:hypothetical protein EGM_09040, partial [Macaca fascicularis]